MGRVVNTSYEIQYQGSICDSWFTYDIPISILLKISLKKLDKEFDVVKEYTKIANGLLKDPRYNIVRLLRVEKEVIYESTTS